MLIAHMHTFLSITFRMSYQQGPLLQLQMNVCVFVCENFSTTMQSVEWCNKGAGFDWKSSRHTAHICLLSFALIPCHRRACYVVSPIAHTLSTLQTEWPVFDSVNSSKPSLSAFKSNFTYLAFLSISQFSCSNNAVETFSSGCHYNFVTLFLMDESNETVN